MSEVHRYKVVKMLSEVGNRIGYSPHGPEVVLASDYDALMVENERLRKDAEFHQQVQRGAGELPHGWEILIRIEKDAGNAELIDPEGNEVDYPSNHEHLADSVSDAIDEALSAEKIE